MKRKLAVVERMIFCKRFVRNFTFLSDIIIACVWNRFFFSPRIPRILVAFVKKQNNRFDSYKLVDSWYHNY